MNLSRLHHYVPQFYLGAWHDKDGKVTVYRRDDEGRISQPFRTIPKNICAERDLYANQAMTLHEAKAQTTEMKFFSKIDGLADVALKELLMTRDFQTTKVRNDWVRFLMSLLHRHPNEVKVIRERALKGWEEVLAGQHQDLTDQIKEKVDGEREELEAGSAVSVESLALDILEKLILSENIGNAIVDIPWVLYTLPSAEWTFLTCDRPLVRTPKLIGADVALFVPVSPRDLFIATRRNDIIDTMNAMNPKTICKDVNTDIVREARQYVVGRDDNQTRFILNRQ